MAKQHRVRLKCLVIGLLVLCGCQSQVSQNHTGSGGGIQPAAKIAAANPTASRINVQLAITYLQQGNIDRARQKLIIAEQQDPHSAVVLDAKAYFLEMTGEPQQAETYYLAAIKVNPKNGDAQNNYGTYLCRNGRYKDSIERFLLAVQDPAYLSPAQAYENAGLCSLKIPNLDNAALYFTKALQKEPSLPTSLLEMAQLSYDKEDYSQASSFLSRYVVYNKASAQSIWLRIQVAEKLDDKQTAASNIEMLEREFASSREYQAYKASRSK